MNVGTAVFKAIADFDSVIRESGRGADALSGFSGEAERSGGRFRSVMGGVAKIAGLATAAVGAVFSAKAITAGFDRLTTIQDSTAALTVSLGGATQAAEFMDKILGVVSGTPFNLDQFAAAGSQMVGFGIDAGKVPGYLTAIGEASARMGKNAPEAADRLSTAYGRMAASGRLGMDEVNQFSDVGVNALVLLGNHYGVTTDEAREMISKGLVPASEAMDIFADGIMNGSDGVAGTAVALEGTMAGLRETLSGAKGGFGSAVARFGANVISPFTETLTTGFTGAAGVLDAAGTKLNEILTRVVESPGFQKFIDFLTRLPDLASTAFGSLSGVGGKIQSLWSGLTGSDVVVDTISRLGGIFSTLADAAVEVAPAVGQIIASLSAATAAVGISVWEILLTTLEVLADVLVTVLVPMLQALAEWMAENQSTVTTLVALFTAWKIAMMGLAVFRTIMATWRAMQLAYAAATYGAVGATYAQGTAARVAARAGRILSLSWLRAGASAVASAATAAAAWVASGARTVASFVRTGAAAAAQAARTAGAWVASSARSVAAFARMGAAAALSAARAAAAWVLSAARTIAALALQAAAFVAQKVVMLASAIATGIVTAAQWLLNAAMLANPIVWIILAIVALIAAFIWLWNNVEGFRNFFVAAWDMIKAAVSAVVDWFTNTLWPAIVAVWDAIVAALKWVVDMYIAYWTAIWNAIQAVWNWIVAFIQDAIARVVAILQGIWATIQAVIDFFQRLRDGIVEKIQAAVDFLRGLPGMLIDALGDLGQMLFDSGKAIMQGLIDGIKNMGSNVADAVGGVLAGARDLLPFSPAKEGPFSGKGWTLYAGRSISEALATGIDDNGDMVENSTEALMSRASGALNVNGSITAGMGNAPSPMLNDPLRAMTGMSTGTAGTGTTVNLTVNNPKPERASDTLARQIRKVSEIGVK